MTNEIEKPNPDDVLAAITSFNDPSIITNIFRELGWTYSFEIKEWLILAKQNANLSVKSKALIQLRHLLQEAAETAGYTAKISQTMPNAQGGQTTFSAKRISGILNPVKQIKSTIKESKNVQTEETRTEPNRESDRRENETENGSGENTPSPDRGSKEDSIRDTRRAFPLGDAEFGGIEPPDGGEISGRVAGGCGDGADNCKDSGTTQRGEGIGNGGSGGVIEGGSPCIKTRPPTCDRDLFPGISSAEE